MGNQDCGQGNIERERKIGSRPRPFMENGLKAKLKSREKSPHIDSNISSNPCGKKPKQRRGGRDRMAGGAAPLNYFCARGSYDPEYSASDKGPGQGDVEAIGSEGSDPSVTKKKGLDGQGH